MSAPDWRPAASPETLVLRARLLAGVRAFLSSRGVLEVETPMLSRAATPAPALDSLETRVRLPGAAAPARMFLHTSPEFPMKRLLAAGCGPIFQLCKVFRDAEAGPRHNPEFTLLEWYRPGWRSNELIDEVEALVAELLAARVPSPPWRRLPYAELFHEFAGVDGLSADAATLAGRLTQAGVEVTLGADEDIDVWRDLVLARLIEPELARRGEPLFVVDYPASQAALAARRPDRPQVADRFELYVGGLELANGFYELTDPVEQRARFEAENAARRAAGRPEMPLDETFLAALEAGMPAGSGVALGFDRLVMLAAGVDDIREVLAFPVGRA